MQHSTFVPESPIECAALHAFVYRKMLVHNKWRIIRLLTLVGLSLLLVLLILFIVVMSRTFTLKENLGLQFAQWENTTIISADISKQQREVLLANFKAAIRIPSVSFSQTHQNTSALREFDQLLRRVFPNVFSSSLVKHEVVGNYSHLFTVLGTDPELVPYMLLAHIDVVPANEVDGWEAPPFSAKELNGFIYGRGTIDNKQCVMGILQAVEYLLERGYVPRRGFYIGLGHDEEVYGYNGAVNIAKVLKSGGVKLQYILDEGLAVMDGIITGLNGPAALIGVSEKGQATVKLSASTRLGHSSMPPKENSIGILAAAITRLEESPMPRLFGYGPEQSTFEHLAHKFQFPLRFMMSNLWLFNPLLSRVMERRPDMNAFVRTTTAVTMFNSGVKVNVLPSHAEAFVNLRIHPAQTLQEVLDLIKSTISDNRVKLELVDGFDSLPISSYDEQSFGYQIIKKTLLDMFPQVTVAPSICIGNTDSRHYMDLTQDIYRFNPTWLRPGEPERIHGINERMSVQNYEEIVLFYFQLIQESDIRILPPSHTGQHEL
ncbi:N-fatty-acyl-amino acid synthase/hydrolase PM20D1.2 [Electrophorus electricus]|uniref:Peptidase M20 dimerisation domain-containing protein n=1 Tax=Electrophorus electricus TaxID=8005 RepID=A0A4W4ELB7_ELEEL|nr:N-fatty-acyl-amino acid synthase/hydrolase PM20D1.2 [Electrophorus electricus]